MGSDVSMGVRQPSCCWLQGGSLMASPSWFLLHHKGHYRSNSAGRFHVLGQEAAAASDAAHGRRSWRWRSFFRRLMKEGKCLHGGSKPPPLTFHYDIVSYHKNFDDGCSCGEAGQLAGRCPQW